MFQILQRPDTASDLFARQLGGGLEKGIDLATQLSIEKMKKSSFFEDFQKLRRGKNENNKDKSNGNTADQLKGNSSSPMSENVTQLGGPSFNAKPPMEQQESMKPDMDGGLEDLDLLERMALAEKHPDAMKIFESERKEGRKETFSRETSAEKELSEMDDSLRSLQDSGMRYERLSELSSPEKEVKFPNRTMSSLFSKDGELNDLAMSQLSPDAQEFVKLLSDELNGAQKTFGGRVTNFELSQYKRKLPSLLNSPEGRRRVLRDLKIMNTLNKEYYSGLLDYIDSKGGVGKQSLSKMKRDFRKQFTPREVQLRKEFVKGPSSSFESLPDASLYHGEEVMDEDTGQRFRSDGKEWTPL